MTNKEKRKWMDGNVFFQCEKILAKFDDTSGTTPKFKMLAYNGGVIIRFAGDRVVVDLSGLTYLGDKIPVRLNHDHTEGVGHTTAIEVRNNKRLYISGKVSRDTEAAREIVASYKKGFPWEASIGVAPTEIEFISDNMRTTVNGKTFKGPLYLLKESELIEVSFVDKGASQDTKVSLAAQQRGTNMDPKSKKNKDGDDDAIRKIVELQDKGVQASDDETGNDPVEPTKDDAESKLIESKKVKTSDKVTASQDDGNKIVQASVDQMRTELVGEKKRVLDIQKVCAGEHDDVEVKAIEAGWDDERTELEILRKDRPTVTAIHMKDNTPDSKVLEVAVLTAGRFSQKEIEAKYDEKTLDEAHRKYQGTIGLQELILEAAHSNGYSGRGFKSNHRRILRYAFDPGIVEAGPSLIDLPGILGNVSNTFLLAGFNSIEQTWRAVSSSRPVTDFKQITSYRMTGTDQYDLVAPGGLLKHGDLGEESFTNKADTYGKIMSIDRRNIINDDLGALTDVPKKLGMGSGRKINDIFWTEFMDNSAFFTAGLLNYFDGADSNLSVDSLTTAERMFMDQIDADGNPTGAMPALLLVPTGLSVTAAGLFNSLEIRHQPSHAGTGKEVISNPHQGKFTPHTSRYLGNSNYTGNSQLGWYLLANPSELSVIEVVFLNGSEVPVIETADADFNTLGIQMRGYHDFGVNKQDDRGGVKSKGEA